MRTIFPSKYSFMPENEVKYVEWMFTRNKRLILSVAVIAIFFISIITVLNLITEEVSLSFNLILLFRVLMLLLTTSIFIIFRQNAPLRARNILFINLLLIIMINTVDNYICLVNMENVLSPTVQMFTLYLFMLVPFISFLQKLLLGAVFIGGIVFCIIVLNSGNSWETMFFVGFVFVAEMLVSYRLECLSRAQFKAILDDREQHESLIKSRQELKEALAAEREIIKQNENFIDMISHEYRTPLSVIASSLDSLETIQVVNNSSEVNSYVQMIRRASRRLLSIYESFLYEKRISISGILPDKKLFEILGIVETAAEFTRSIYQEHNIRINDDIPPDATIIADNELLTTAIINILDNACKYSSPSNIDISLTLNNTFCIMEISDTGNGIDKSEISSVFEKYYRSEKTKQKPGSGVGLYIVRKIIELHGGKIEIRSIIRVGTTVIITLPVKKDTANEQ